MTWLNIVVIIFFKVEIIISKWSTTWKYNWYHITSKKEWVNECEKYEMKFFILFIFYIQKKCKETLKKCRLDTSHTPPTPPTHSFSFTIFLLFFLKRTAHTLDTQLFHMEQKKKHSRNFLIFIANMPLESKN